MALSTPALDDLSFKYTAVDRTGKQVRDVVRARDARAATRALVAEGLTPISVQETRVRAKGGKDRELSFSEKVSVLRQLALMVEAGVGLLEAMQTIAPGVVAIKGRLKLEGVIAALKRGENFAHALETQAPGFPFYVYAMSRMGEATGKLPEVLKEAAEQMAFEDRLRKDFTSAMIYPAFLLCVGVGVVTLMMVKVLPSFKGMIGDNRDKLPLISKVMFALSDALTTHIVVIGLVVGGVVVALIGALSNKTVRTGLYAGARGAPVIGGIFKAREITSWARLLGFGLTSGVNLLEAARLARIGAPEGPFKQGLEQFERDLKSGVDVADSLSRHTELTAMDLSLLRAGQKSGTLPRMFLYVAETYDSRLRDKLKQVSSLVEPLTIGFIAIMVATLALSIVLAMLTLYENIG
jgi:type II secretory pathway component PulF